jgi:hypothetical protein
MNKIKTYIDWSYDVHALNSHNWINSSIDDADLVVSINGRRKIESKAIKVLWLLEPESIEQDLYKATKEERLAYDYIVSHRDDLVTVNSHIQISPCTPSWINPEERKIYEKTKNISMIASRKIMCQGHLYRQEIAKKVSQFVDIYGRGRNFELDSKIDGLKDYRFSIAMENGCYNTYFTEKILDCFFVGTIPIYWGTENINKIFNPKGIIFLEDFMAHIDKFNFEEEYQNRIEAIKENFEIAKSVNFTSADGIHKIVKKVFNQ